MHGQSSTEYLAVLLGAILVAGIVVAVLGFDLGFGISQDELYWQSAYPLSIERSAIRGGNLSIALSNRGDSPILATNMSIGPYSDNKWFWQDPVTGNADEDACPFDFARGYNYCDIAIQSGQTVLLISPMAEDEPCADKKFAFSPVTIAYNTPQLSGNVFYTTRSVAGGCEPSAAYNRPPAITVDTTFLNSSWGHTFIAWANATDRDGAADIVSYDEITNASCQFLSQSVYGKSLGVRYSCTVPPRSFGWFSVLFQDTAGNNATSSNRTNAYPNSPPAISSGLSFANHSTQLRFNASATAVDYDGAEIVDSQVFIVDGDASCVFLGLNSTGNYSTATYDCAKVSSNDSAVVLSFEDTAGAAVNSSAAANAFNQPPVVSGETSFLNSSPGHSFFAWANATDPDGAFDIAANASVTNATCSFVSESKDGASYGTLYNCTVLANSFGWFSIAFDDSHGNSAVSANRSNAYPNLAPVVSSDTVFSNDTAASAFNVTATAFDPDGIEIAGSQVYVTDGAASCSLVQSNATGNYLTMTYYCQRAGAPYASVHMSFRDLAGAEGDSSTAQNAFPDIKIAFVPPTDANGATVTGNWLSVNVSTYLDAPGQSVAVNLDNSLVGWWRLDEGSGATTADSSGHGAAGTLVNNPPWGPGMYGSSLHIYSASGGYVDVGDRPQFNISTGDFTVMFWYRLPSPSSGNSFLSKFDTAANTGFYIYQTGPSNLVARLVKGGQFQVPAVDRIVPDTNWHHGALLRNATRVMMFRDGVAGRWSYSNLFLDIQNTAPLLIGKWGSTLNGAIDDVRFFNRGLSQAEIASAYNSSKFAYFSNFTALPPGAHRFNATVTNATGEVYSTETRTVTTS